MAFNWETACKRAELSAIEDAKTMSKANNNPDWIEKHPDWCRDANIVDANNNPKPLYTQLVKQVKEACQKSQLKARQRRNKRIGL